MDKQIRFELSEEETRYVRKFEKQHKDCPKGFAFDQFDYSFTPTAVGLLTTIKCSCGQVLSFSSDVFPTDLKEYNEAEHRPLTQKDLDNDSFEKAVFHILFLRNPRIFRIVFKYEPSLEILYGFAFGLAYYQKDTRLGSCVLAAEHLNNKSLIEDSRPEEEKLDCFYRSFARGVKRELDTYQSTNIKLMKQLEELM